jgi:hypothetical protein
MLWTPSPSRGFRSTNGSVQTPATTAAPGLAGRGRSYRNIAHVPPARKPRNDAEPAFTEPRALNPACKDSWFVVANEE